MYVVAAYHALLSPSSPDAYTRLVLEVLRGKQATFVRSDELLESWRVFTPILNQIDAGELPPIPYTFGTRGPKESDDLISKMGYKYNNSYDWTEHHLQQMQKKH